MCTKNRDQRIFQLTNSCCIHFKCGFPCSHILRITNDLELDMIKIQHWKIYAAQYNDESSGIGMELKKIQLAYRHYEGLGVPISGELLTWSRKCNLDRVFPYLYDGTSNDDYKLALKVDRSNCSVTVSEFFSTKQNTKHNTIDTMEKDFALENCFTCKYTVGDADLVAFSTPQNAKQMSSLQQDLSRENKDQTK